MTIPDNSVKVLSANCQGLRNSDKRVDVLNYLKETNASIVCLQDTHLLDADEQSVKQIWNDCYLHGKRTNARGVGILINNNFEYETTGCHKDSNGNYIQLYIKFSSMTINLINVYAPNHDDPRFFKENLITQLSVGTSTLCSIQIKTPLTTPTLTTLKPELLL